MLALYSLKTLKDTAFSEEFKSTGNPGASVSLGDSTVAIGGTATKMARLTYASGPCHLTMENLGVSPYTMHVSKISKKARQKLIALLDANYRFSNIFYQKYLHGTEIDIHNLNRELLNIPRTKFNKQMGSPGYKMFAQKSRDGLAKDVEDFNEKLQLLKQEADHQRIVDDLYEESRCFVEQFGLCSKSIQNADRLDAITKSLFSRLRLEVRLELKTILEPYKSEFQKLFEKHYSLNVISGMIVGYEHKTGKSGFLEEIIKELKAIEIIYRVKNDLEGLKHIASQLAILATDIGSQEKFVKAACPYNYRRPSANLSPKQQGIRTVNYYRYVVLLEARKFKAAREIVWKKEEHEKNQKPVTPNPALVSMHNVPNAVGSTTTANPTAASPAQPLADITNRNTENEKLNAEVLPEKFASAAVGASAAAGASATALVNSNDTSLAVTVKPNNQKVKLICHKPGVKVANAANVVAHPLSSTIQGKHKTTLVDLFDKKGLSHVKIKLQSILDFFTAIGCKVTQNGVRVSFTYQNVLGYCVGEQNTEGQGNGFHVKDRDGNHGGKNPYLHEVALEHCKDFCENIGIIPKLLWPKEFPTKSVNPNAAMTI